MKTRILYTLRDWAHYINHCPRAAYIALLLLVLLTLATGARACFNAGAAHAMRHCKVYANEHVKLVYSGRIYNR